MMLKPPSFLPFILAADPKNFSLFFFFPFSLVAALAKISVFSSHFSAVSAPFSLFFFFPFSLLSSFLFLLHRRLLSSKRE
jgi:hypothetical protein